MKINPIDGDCAFCVVEDQIRMLFRIDNPVQQSIFANKIKSNEVVKPNEIGLKTFGENYLDYFNEISILLNEMIQNHTNGINNSDSKVNELFYNFFAFLEFRYEIVGLTEKPEIGFVPFNKNYSQFKTETKSMTAPEILHTVPEA